jgi:cell division protein FtsB
VRGSLVGTTRPQTLANRARNGQRDRRAIYRRIIWIMVVAQLSWISGSPGAAQDVSKEQMQGLDEQVQEIKSDVLSIAAELNRLEEKLLYPSSTQVAIFVSLAEGEALRLDSVQIQIDGAPVARHIYSFKELEALQKGGVQRIYTGNVSTGEHRLEVSVAGKRSSGTDLSATESFSFSKDVEPKLVGLTLAGGDSGAASIRLGAW